MKVSKGKSEERTINCTKKSMVVSKRDIITCELRIGDVRNKRIQKSFLEVFSHPNENVNMIPEDISFKKRFRKCWHAMIALEEKRGQQAEYDTWLVFKRTRDNIVRDPPGMPQSPGITHEENAT